MFAKAHGIPKSGTAQRPALPLYPIKPSHLPNVAKQEAPSARKRLTEQADWGPSKQTRVLLRV